MINYDWLTQNDPYTGGSHTPPALRALLMTLINLIDAKVVIETGYDLGYTTRALAVSKEDVQVWAVDNLTEYGEFDKDVKEMLKEYPNVCLFQQDAVEFLENIDDESIDLIFIDDKHEPLHVKKEIEIVVNKLRDGGIIVFHDTNIILLRNAIDEALPKSWGRVYFPAISPRNGYNYGFGIAVKPFVPSKWY